MSDVVNTRPESSATADDKRRTRGAGALGSGYWGAFALRNEKGDALLMRRDGPTVDPRSRADESVRILPMDCETVAAHAMDACARRAAQPAAAVVTDCARAAGSARAVAGGATGFATTHRA